MAKTEKTKKASATKEAPKTKAKKQVEKPVEKLETKKRTVESAPVEVADKPKKVHGKRGVLAPKTYFAKTGEVPSQWKLIDASGQRLGRLSSHIAKILMGKFKPQYTAHIDTGDHVIVINASKIEMTGKKWEQKEYHHHTQFPGGIKTTSAKSLQENNPERLIELAVYRMLPKSKGHMARHWFKKLKVYAGSEHPHIAQQPEVVKLPNLI
jgi:large subunit ribosomal protein L13